MRQFYTPCGNISYKMADNVTQIARSSHDNSTTNYAYFSAEADIFPLLLAVLIVMINFWVLYLVFKYKILRTITNYILSSLAFSDLLTGLLSIPFFVACNIMRNASFCLTSDALLRFTSISTVAHLLAVTIDRYLAIMYALRYSTIMTKGRAVYTLTFIWVTSALLSLIQFSWMNPLDHDVMTKQSEDAKQNEIFYDVFCIVVYFSIPLLFMIYAYGHIFYQVLRQHKIMTYDNRPGSSSGARISIDKHKWKAALIFFVMLSVYVVCWLPYFALRLAYNYIDPSHLDVPPGVLYLILYIRFCTSLFNPLLYILGKQDFRKTILGYFERSRRPARSLGGTSSLLRSTDV